MYILTIVLTVLISILLIIVVLVQKSKGGVFCESMPGPSNNEDGHRDDEDGRHAGKKTNLF